MQPSELAARLTSLDWSDTSLQHQLAISCVVETLRAERRVRVLMTSATPMDTNDSRRFFPIPADTAPHALPIGHNVVALVRPGAAKHARTVTLLHLDGSTFRAADFAPGLASAPWNWIAKTVAAELGCEVEAVGCAENDLVTVDGLPVYRVAIGSDMATPDGPVGAC